jgi:hypothetical protein
MTVKTILSLKGGTVATIEPGASLATAASCSPNEDWRLGRD